METPSANIVFLYRILSIFFIVIGTVTVLNKFLGYSLNQSYSVIGFLYMIMNYLLAYGLWTRKRWVIPVTAINAVGVVGILILKYTGILSPSTITRQFGMTVLALGVSAIVIQTRRFLRGDYVESLGIFMIVLWLAAFVLNIRSQIF